MKLADRTMTFVFIELRMADVAAPWNQEMESQNGNAPHPTNPLSESTNSSFVSTSPTSSLSPVWAALISGVMYQRSLAAILSAALLASSQAETPGKVAQPAEIGPDLVPFSQEVVSDGLEDPMMFEILPDGSTLIIERLGNVKHQTASSITVLASLSVESHANMKNGQRVEVSGFGGNFARECGLLGLALDPNFEKTGFVYLVYSPKDKLVNRLSRFTFKNAAWDERSEVVILDVPHDRKDKACHESGCLDFDSKGNLYWSIGDNTNPWGNAAGCGPQNENDPINNALRTSANSADLRGGILRIKPLPDGSYEIPEGNLFTDELSRKETYIKGCRNPFRISVDRKTDTLYWGDVGPDARKDSERGPKGYDEVNRATKAGFHGWPLFVADNKPYQVHGQNQDLATIHTKGPLNPSAFNTGLKRLPVPQGSWLHYSYDEHPIYGSGARNAMSGPVIYAADSNGALPAYLDRSLVIYDWMRGFLRFVQMNKDGKILYHRNANLRFTHPIAIKQGPNGHLYVLEYGSKWTGNKNGRLLRLKYDETNSSSGRDSADPILTMMHTRQCMACHLLHDKSVGPAFREVAQKYLSLEGQTREEIVNTLKGKIKNGGVGVWGQVPMPPQPHVKDEELDQILEYILKLKKK